MASSSLVVRPCDVCYETFGDGNCSTVMLSRCVAPWLMLPPDFEEDTTVFNFYRLAKGDVIHLPAEQEQDVQTPDMDSVCLGSLSKGWLVCIQPKDCVLFLFNPLSGKTIQLPSIETFPCVKGVILNHSGVVESFLNHDSFPITPQRMSEYIVKKMVLSSPDPMDEDCIALVIYGSRSQLAFCRRPGVPNSSWTPLDGPLKYCTQIVFHPGKKLFFALTKDKELEAWDLHNGDQVERFRIQIEDIGSDDDWPCSAIDDAELELKSYYCWDTDYFVCDHQSQELFVVTRYIAHAVVAGGNLLMRYDEVGVDCEYPYQTQTFDVFKLHFIDHDYVELQFLGGSLGDRAFFIGSTPGFALSTTQFPELRPNSVYFTDDQAYLYKKKPHYGGHDLGIFDCKERIILSCYYPVDIDKIQRILPAPVWFTPDVDAEDCLQL